MTKCQELKQLNINIKTLEQERNKVRAEIAKDQFIKDLDDDVWLEVTLRTKGYHGHSTCVTFTSKEELFEFLTRILDD